MLTDLEIEQLFAKLELQEEGRRLVRSARANSPVRAVKSQVGNWIVRRFSRKMDGRQFDLESRSVEAPAAELYENDPECLEFWTQPFTIDLDIRDNDGQTRSRMQHTPDFLIIRNEAIYVHEWHTESRLMKMASKSKQVFKDENSRWHHKAIEEYFKNSGLLYELHSAIELPHNSILNIRFLEDYQKTNCPPLSTDEEQSLQKLFSERASIPFQELINEYGYQADTIYKAIIKKIVFADLINARLDVSTDLMIHRDMAIVKAYHIISIDRTPPLPIPGMGRLSAGTRISFNGKIFEVMLVGGTDVMLRNDEGDLINLPLDDVKKLYSNNDIDLENSNNAVNPGNGSLDNYSKEQIETANTRLDAINNGNTVNVCKRTLQRWKAKTVGAVKPIDKLMFLVDTNREKGNRDDRLPKIVNDLAIVAIDKHFNTKECRTALATYQQYQLLSEENNVKPMSYPTFTKRVKEKTSIENRKGKRKANQEESIPLYLDYHFPVNGFRPHEVCYIDHTVTNVATIGPDGSKLGKPTLTLATDGHTTQTRAFYLSYDPPSAQAVLMVLRDYVRRHQRLPKILIVDNGKEFWSNELKFFCRCYEIDLRYRPPHRPRSGSLIEQAIGDTEVEVLAKLKGNTRIMKDNTRMVTKSVSPFTDAEWTLTALHGSLENFLFELKDNRIHPRLGVSPHDYEQMRLKETGQREHIFVKFDQNIMLLTSPHSKGKGWYRTIDHIRGVYVDGMYYWHEALRMAEQGEKAEVRIEPWHAGVVYVYFNKRWIAAIARNAGALHGRTQREAAIAIREEKRLAKTNAQKDRTSLSAAKNMDKLWKPENFDERIGKQQREMVYLYSKLRMTVAMPEVLPEIKATYNRPISEENHKQSPVEREEETPKDNNDPPDDSDSYGDAYGYH